MSSIAVVNVDAACDSQQKRIGMGVVIRNERGGLLCAKMEAILGSLSVFAAEAQALLLGLRVCLEEGFRKVEIESDALLVIRTIEACNWDLSSEGHLFDKIKSITDQLEEVKFKKIPRLCNGVVHSLVKAAIPILGQVFWKEVGPPWLEKLITNDMSS